MPEPIHLFVPQFRTEEVLAEIRPCLDSGWTGLGNLTLKIEEAWRQYTGMPHAHFLNSATAGLHLAVHVLKQRHGWQDDDEIITTPLTFVSTAHAILYARMRPVFADVDEYLCLDPQSVAERITPRTRAVLFMGMGGNPGRYLDIVNLCVAHGLRLILDAAHMAGTRLVDGEHVGPEADAAVFSFHAVKNLPTADSGMVCFRRGEDDAMARKLSWLGIDKDTYSRTQVGGAYAWRYDVPEVGFKYHGNSIMAAMALVGLRYLDADNVSRRLRAAWYDQALMSCGQVRRVLMAEHCKPSRHLYQVRVANRDGVMARLNAERIYSGCHYRSVTEFSMYLPTCGPVPLAEAASAELISLPLHVRLSREDVCRVARALEE